MSLLSEAKKEAKVEAPIAQEAAPAKKTLKQRIPEETARIARSQW